MIDIAAPDTVLKLPSFSLEKETVSVKQNLLEFQCYFVVGITGGREHWGLLVGCRRNGLNQVHFVPFSHFGARTQRYNLKQHLLPREYRFDFVGRLVFVYPA